MKQSNKFPQSLSSLKSWVQAQFFEIAPRSFFSMNLSIKMDSQNTMINICMYMIDRVGSLLIHGCCKQESFELVRTLGLSRSSVGGCVHNVHNVLLLLRKIRISSICSCLLFSS